MIPSNRLPTAFQPVSQPRANRLPTAYQRGTNHVLTHPLIPPWGVRSPLEGSRALWVKVVLTASASLAARFPGRRGGGRQAAPERHLINNHVRCSDYPIVLHAIMSDQFCALSASCRDTAPFLAPEGSANAMQTTTESTATGTRRATDRMNRVRLAANSSAPLPLVSRRAADRGGWGQKPAGVFQFHPHTQLGTRRQSGTTFFSNAENIRMAVRHDSSPVALQRAMKREADKPGRHKTIGRGSGLTPRVRKAIDLMVFGGDDGSPPVAEDFAAAAAVGLTVRSLRAAMLKPAVDGYYKQQMTAKRNGLKALGLHTIQDIMTDPELKKTAAGARVRTDAAKVVLNDPPGMQFNVQVNSSIKVTPGYVLDLSPDPMEREPIEPRGGGKNALGLYKSTLDHAIPNPEKSDGKCLTQQRNSGTW